MIPLGVRPAAPPAAPWPPFVVAALLLTLTFGSLTGALDLWSLRVTLEPVPLDHSRAHAMAQLFGFFGLFIIGVSLHLAPRFFGAAAPEASVVRGLRWLAITGVVLAAAGRLGRLVPGSMGLGLLGTALLTAAMGLWLREVVRFAREGLGPLDPLQRFVLCGTGWWTLAALLLLCWQFGQYIGGAPSAIPLEAVWNAALYGGTASWMWGIFLRAGLCTLGLQRPTARAMVQVWAGWQLAVALLVVTPFWRVVEGPAFLALAAASVHWFVTLRPWHFRLLPEPGLQRRSVQVGLAFLGLSALLAAWSALVAFGGPGPALLRDATRHAFTLGAMTPMLLGFAGRMIPSFRGAPLRLPRVYDAGVVAVALSAAVRLLELLPLRSTIALAGSSGGLAFLGLLLVSTSLLSTLRPVRLPRPGTRKVASWVTLLVLLVLPAKSFGAACCLSVSVVGNGRLSAWEAAAGGLTSSWAHGVGRWDSSQTFHYYVGSFVEEELRFEAWAMARLAQRWQLQARVPWVVGVREAAGVSSVGTGPGDLSASVRFEALSLGEWEHVPGLAWTGGLVAPTGRRPELALDALGASATGRGAWAFSLGLTVEEVWAPWFVRLDAGVLGSLPFTRVDTGAAQTWGLQLQVAMSGGRALWADRVVLAATLRLEHEWPYWLDGAPQRGSEQTGVSVGASAALKVTPHWTVTASVASDAAGHLGLARNHEDRLAVLLGARLGFF